MVQSRGTRVNRGTRNVVRAGARTDLAARIDAAMSGEPAWTPPTAPTQSTIGPQTDVVEFAPEYTGEGQYGNRVWDTIWNDTKAAVRDIAASPAVPWNPSQPQPGSLKGITPNPRITSAEVQGGGLTPDQRAGYRSVQQAMAAERDKARGYQNAMADYDQQIRELNAAALKAVQAGADDVARQYDEQIAELQKQRDDVRLQMQRSMAAYESYAAQIEPAYLASIESAIAGEEAHREAMAGRGDAAVAQIESNRDASVEDIEELATLIGVGELSPDSIDDAMGEFAGMIGEAVRGRLGDVDRIGAAAAKFATALANAEGATALFDNDIEKQGLEAQLKGQLADIAEAVAKLEKDKKAAVERAMAQYDPIGGFEDPDEAFRYAFDSIALNSGWDLDEKDAVWAMFGEAMGDGMRTHNDIIEWIDERLASDAAGLLGEHLQSTGVDLAEIPDGHKALFDDLLSGDKARQNEVLGVLQRLYPDAGLGYDLVKGLFGSRADYQHLIDTFDAYETHVNEWEKRKYVPVKKGTSAPNNYANRNAPQYKARREVGVPTFSNLFLAAFGKEGSGREYIGGVTRSYQGTIRSPDAVGGGKAANSDHQSGGAIDLYADSVEELEAIERWANSQPGVSYVTYSGNKYHETGKAGGASSGVSGRGHVHVSLLLGYWG